MNNREELKQLGLGIAKGAIGAVPVAGELLNQLIFDVRGSVKMARYNKFIDALSDYMNTHYNVPLTIEQIEVEEVGDFFESVVAKVTKINSEKKVEALKRLLASKIVTPKDFDYAEVLVELIAGLSDYEVVILQKIIEDGGSYADNYSGMYEIKQELVRLNSRKKDLYNGTLSSEDDFAYAELERLIDQEKEKQKSFKEKLEAMKTAYEPSTYGIDAWELHFHITQLLRKGILQDYSGKYGLEACTVVSPNQLAFDIVDFLSDKK